MKRLVPSRELVAYLDRELPSPVAPPAWPGPAGPPPPAVALAPAPLPAPPALAWGPAAVGAYAAQLQPPYPAPSPSPTRRGALPRTALVLAAIAFAFVVLAVLVVAVARARDHAPQTARRRGAPVVLPMAAGPSTSAAEPSSPEEPWCAAPRTGMLASAVPPPAQRRARARARPASFRASERPAREWPVFAAVLGVLGVVGAVVADDVRRSRKQRREVADRALRIGAASRCGGRKYNEDRATAFALGPYDVIVCADGLGGHAGGSRAASLVVEAAERHLRATLSVINAEHMDLVEDAVCGAFARAGSALGTEDSVLGLASLGIDGLRSTLVVAVATRTRYLVGAQGDGGALVRRSDGKLVQLMSPAKAGAQNVLAASLGPVCEGQVEIRRAPRLAGDLLVVSTDGVADRVQDSFYDALAEIVAKSGDVQTALGETLDELEHDRATFDDNMTLAALLTEER
ncbi:MAG: protein phosphatase 2C domain-containing protein [Deltaproteobacteria bacterium]|nr:protein phosphatase 2C domain-containing protein [Deltaproteobacteria bacterium]